MDIAVRELGPETVRDFFALHEGESCYCMYWHFPGSNEEWMKRTAAGNRADKEALLAQGREHGMILYVDGSPVGWCQVARRRDLPKLDRVAPPDDVTSITCFYVARDFRKKGLARELLLRTLDHLRATGVRVVEAYPKKGEGHEDGEVWTGPLRLYTSCGFALHGDGDPRVVVRRVL